MPVLPNYASGIRVNFADILQGIEDKLVQDLVVTPTQVSWAVNDVLPQLNGNFDVLLRARTANRVNEDGGSWDLRFRRLVDVTIRTLSIMDPGAGNKIWVKKHFLLSDSILNSIGASDFFPKDSLGQHLTTEAIKPTHDIAPERRSDASTWGDSVCTLEVVYLPLITPTPLV